jgi:drug/metabolite transporter (DMT)-like permease
MTVLCVAWWGIETVFLIVFGTESAGQSASRLAFSFSSPTASSDPAAVAAGGVSALTVWGAVAYSALAPGALANVLQTRGQSRVPAAEAQLIFATTPVFNAALAAGLGETASAGTVVGGGVILAASLAPFLWDTTDEHERNDKN